MKEFMNLAKPINIGGVFMRNRIAMAPMNDFHQFYDPVEGTINRRWIDYFAERAKGGVGLIITGVFKVEDEITRFRQNDMVTWALVKKKSMQNYAELAKYAHAFGAKIFMQLTAGPGRVISGTAIDDGFEPVSASANQAYFRPNVTCRALDTSEVDQIVEAFGQAAEIVHESGIDGIEVHGHEGYLIDQFTTSLWNRRTDKYGGDLEGRLTFPIEILKAIKKRVGDDFPVTYRYGSKHFIKGPWKSALRMGEREMGRDIDESIQMAKLLERAGYGALHVDTGCYESAYWAHPPMYLPHGFSVDLTWEVKKVVKIPVIAVGRLGIPEIAEKVLAEGKADMIALGRDLLADPYWPKKVLGGEAQDARFCIGCHECMFRAETGQYLTCAVNPLCGNEGVVSIQPSWKAKKVLIAGGGVGGMEAARMASIRGYHVSLFEKTGNLGGHLIAGSVPDFKKDIKGLLDWYQLQLTKLKVKTKLNTAVTPELIKNENPDIVIIATGSVPMVPKMPGVEKPLVTTCIDLLLDRGKAGDRVIVVGGGLEGCETALWLSRQGKKVSIVEMLSQLIIDVHRANRTMLLDLLEDDGVNILTYTKIIEIEDGGVIAIDKKLNTMQIGCDTVVLAVGLKSDNQLYSSLVGDSREVYEIGDCKKPRKIADAIWEADMLALNL